MLRYVNQSKTSKLSRYPIPLLPLGEMYLEQGYNILAPDLRGAGNTSGSNGMGYLESLDVFDWLTYLNNRYSNNCSQILVHGVSLGGATTLFLSGLEVDGQTIKDKNVIGLVDDCGYTSMTGIIKDLLNTVGDSELAREFELVEQFEEENAANQIFLDGFICKESVYRKTPLGREIADLLVAVNRSYGKSDYIPCICWGRNARFASGFEVGSHVQIWGRIQSREYVKKVSETQVEQRVAYEVSVSKIEFLE